MHILSQNKKIAISAMAIFIVSFSVMVFFLEKSGGGLNSIKTDVLHNSHGGGHEATEMVDDPEYVYRSLVKNAKDAIFVTNLEGYITFASDEFCDSLQVECDRLDDKSVFDFVVSDELAGFTRNYTKFIQDGVSVAGVGPYRMSSGEGKVQSLALLNVDPVNDHEGALKELIFTVKDLTDQANALSDENEASMEETASAEVEEISFEIDEDLSEEEKRDAAIDKVKLVVDRLGEE